VLLVKVFLHLLFIAPLSEVSDFGLPMFLRGLCPVQTVPFQFTAVVGVRGMQCVPASPTTRSDI
jgi:hypothetical protein